PGRAADSADYFYRIQSVDAAGNRGLSNAIAAKVRIAFSSGLNLLGVPLRLTDPAFVDFAAGIAWADASTYDACAGGVGWSSAIPTDAASFSLVPGRGFWMNGTAPGSLTALGVVLQTNRIRLCAGWNLVALPGFAAGMTAGSLIAATGATRSWGSMPRDRTTFAPWRPATRSLAAPAIGSKFPSQWTGRSRAGDFQPSWISNRSRSGSS